MNIKPCPFCGCSKTYQWTEDYLKSDKNDKLINADGKESTVACNDCDASISGYGPDEQSAIKDAITAWNKRVTKKK